MEEPTIKYTDKTQTINIRVAVLVDVLRKCKALYVPVTLKGKAHKRVLVMDGEVLEYEVTGHVQVVGLEFVELDSGWIAKFNEIEEVILGWPSN